MHQNFANLDAFAASAQSIFHTFATPDYGYPAQLLRKVNTDVWMACLGDHALLLEG
jgi:hypothetical protein